MKPQEIRLTEQEVPIQRRAAREINELRTSGASPEVYDVRLGELVDTIRYLLDQAEAQAQGPEAVPLSGGPGVGDWLLEDVPATQAPEMSVPWFRLSLMGIEARLRVEDRAFESREDAEREIVRIAVRELVDAWWVERDGATLLARFRPERM